MVRAMLDEHEMAEQVFSQTKAVFAFRDSLSAETDRGCALMTASYLDSELERLLKAYLIEDAKLVDKLFEPAGPLGSFSVRIDVAFAMGLLDSNTHRELHLIRRIRNDFGHSYETLSFETVGIRDRCRELKRIPNDPNVKARVSFVRTAMGILAILHTRIRCAQRPRVPEDRLTPDVLQKLTEERESFVAYILSDPKKVKQISETSDNSGNDILQDYLDFLRSRQKKAEG
jgi:DNA-binding MltR family transcriptional regulator